MNSVFFKERAPRPVSIFFVLLLAFSLVFAAPVSAQQTVPAASDDRQPKQTAEPLSTATPEGALFHLERERVEGGAELLTIFGSLRGLPRKAVGAVGGDGADTEENEVPLVSILRDTLGDADPENDRLRYVWMHTYTRPTAGKRLASAVPFLYTRVGNKKRVRAGEPPPALIDLAAPDRDVWRRMMWVALQNLFFDPYGIAVKSSVRAFKRNAEDYRKSHIIRALAVLSLYEAESDIESVFTPVEMREIQSRLMLAERTFGGIVDDSYLQRVYQKESAHWQDLRGHNWELLRQRAEAEGLYFEPLLLPDGSATHAMLWVARGDLEINRNRAFDARFLNIKDPWRDKRLSQWDGYRETRYMDAEHRWVSSQTPGARSVEMIPLALYGLDHPKIPMMLVDFRDGGNPKQREMSRRLLEDVSRNLLSLSPFGDVHYFLGRTVYDFVTGRRGMDINQPSRLRSYSQLKLLLSLSASLDPALREEVRRRVERVSMNPLENDLAAETELARTQYAALIAYARRPDGLPARLDRDRRYEMVPLAHGHTSRFMFRLANLLSLGLYTHREKVAPGALVSQLDTERRLAYHRRFLREVSKSTPLVEVVWKIEDVRRSLRYISEYGSRADAKTARATSRIFARTEDEETRRLCIHSLYRINNETAKAELLRIYRIPDLDPRLRMLSAELLRTAVREEQRIAPADAKAINSAVGQ
ncbi:MAG TPA: hypothetical protein VGB73_14195 [Pyrinomonadaceae bacterium]|jgi:hypothetical protein